MTMGVNYNISQNDFNNLLSIAGETKKGSLTASDMNTLLTKDASDLTPDESSILKELYSSSNTFTANSTFTSASGGATSLNQTQLDTFESSQKGTANISDSDLSSLLAWSGANGGSSTTSLTAQDIGNIITESGYAKNTFTLSNGDSLTQAQIEGLQQLVSSSTTYTPNSTFTSITGGSKTMNWNQLGGYESQNQQSLNSSLNQLMLSMGILPDPSQAGVMDADDPDQCAGVDVQFQ